MSRKEYFAYGSNLNFEQMAYRCPEATVVGTAKLDGYELALQEFLRQHPEITTIELRLDNDAKGRMASVGIQKIYADRYTVHDLPPNIENGDYADMANNNLMARTAAHRAVCR